MSRNLKHILTTVAVISGTLFFLRDWTESLMRPVLKAMRISALMH